MFPSDDQDAADPPIDKTLWLVRLRTLGASRLDDNAAVSRPAGTTDVVKSSLRVAPMVTLDASSDSSETTCLGLAVGLLSSYSNAGESESAVLGGLLRGLLGGD